jgi:hypothetical protein
MARRTCDVWRRRVSPGGPALGSGLWARRLPTSKYYRSVLLHRARSAAAATMGRQAYLDKMAFVPTPPRAVPACPV